MDILIVRHGQAGERADFAKTGRPDSERPLTAEGKRKFRRSLPGLRRASPPIARIATSPFVRAAETARLLKKAFPKAVVVEVPALAHGGRTAECVAWLKRQRHAAVAMVGHEPDLGHLIGLLTTGRSAAPIALKKGGAALIRFEGAVKPGRGVLVWALTPALLKSL